MKGGTARGFSGRFANNLLVLMDSRSFYTPAFSGVYWEQEDTLLEDVDGVEERNSLLGNQRRNKDAKANADILFHYPGGVTL